MDGLSECQVVTSAAVCYSKPSLLQKERHVGRESEVTERWWWSGLTLQFSCGSGSEEKEDDVRK